MLNFCQNALNSIPVLTEKAIGFKIPNPSLVVYLQLTLRAWTFWGASDALHWRKVSHLSNELHRITLKPFLRHSEEGKIRLFCINNYYLSN